MSIGSRPRRGENRCWRCGEPVLWSALNGVPVALSKTAPGHGSIALQTDISGRDTAVLSTSRFATWRRHSEICKSPSFVATAIGRKQR